MTYQAYVPQPYAHLYAPVPKPPRATSRGAGVGSMVALILGALVYTAFCSLYLVVDVRTGLLAVAASIPSTIVVVSLLWLLDRKHPEPWRYLAIAFFWGGSGAFIVGVIPNGIFWWLFGETAAAVIGAPVFEEFGKAFFLFILWKLRPESLASPINGVVYAGLAGAGFAFAENIGYLFDGFEAGEATATFVVRCIFSPFAHPLFTASIGLAFAYGVAKSRGALFGLVCAGYAVAVTLHALWNGSAVVGAAFLVVYLFIMVPAFVTAVVCCLIYRQAEASKLRTTVYRLVHEGAFFPEEAGLLNRKTFKYVTSSLSKQEKKAVHRFTQALEDFCSLAVLSGYDKKTFYPYSTARSALLLKRHQELSILRQHSLHLLVPHSGVLRASFS